MPKKSLQDEATGNAFLTRRQTLQLISGTTVLAALNLSGCGGLFSSGSDSGQAGAIVNVTGTYKLPTNFKTPPGQLKAETAWDSQALNSNGTFGSKMMAGSRPITAYLRDTKTNKYVLTGVLGAGTSGVSASGSAIVLLALSMGIFSLPPQQSKEAILLLEKDPATAKLATVIEGRVVADPYALFTGDAAIAQALLAALKDLKARNPKKSSAGRAQAVTPLVLIQQGEQALAQVVQGDAAGQIKVVNKARRPVTAYTYHVADEDQNGVRADLPQPVPVGQPQQIAATTGVLGSISSFNSSTLYAPVEGPPQTLAVAQGKRKSYYETVVLMASGRDDLAYGDPGFYSDSKYRNVVLSWRQERGNLNIHASLGSIVFELVGSVIGGVAGMASRAAAFGLMAQLETVAAGVSAHMIQAAQAGRYGAVIQEALELAAAADTGPAVQYMLATFVASVEGASANVVALYARGAAIRAMALLTLGVVAAAGAIVSIDDFAFTFNDFYDSSKGEKWDETVVIPSISISPSSVTINGGGTQVFKAITTGVAHGRVLRYKWTLTGGNGVLSEQGAVNVGRTIETAGTDVKLVTTPSDLGKLSILMEVFAIEGASRTSLGTASAAITVVVAEEVVSWSIEYDDRPAGSGGSAYAYFKFDIAPGFTYTFRRKSFPGVYEGTEFNVAIPYTSFPDGPSPDHRFFVYLNSWSELGPVDYVSAHRLTANDVFFFLRQGTQNTLYHSVEIGGSNVPYDPSGRQVTDRLTGQTITISSVGEAKAYLQRLATYENFRITRRPS